MPLSWHGAHLRTSLGRHGARDQLRQHPPDTDLVPHARRRSPWRSRRGRRRRSATHVRRVAGPVTRPRRGTARSGYRTATGSVSGFRNGTRWTPTSKPSSGTSGCQQRGERAHQGMGDGHEVPHDGETVGEIQMRGNNVMLGYYNDDQATLAATCRNLPSGRSPKTPSEPHIWTARSTTRQIAPRRRSWRLPSPARRVRPGRVPSRPAG
jgi:hypothetical protein